MIVNGRRITPPSQIPRRKPVPQSMSLDPESSTPTAREEHHLVPKPYADAVHEEGPHTNGNETYNGVIDEDAIKESPPRIQHARTASEHRPLGEIMDKACNNVGAQPPLSPSYSLRSSRGRPPVTPGKKETFAGAVKQDSDGDESSNGASDGTPAPFAINGSGDDNGQTNNIKSIRGISGDRTPESYSGVGVNDSPTSPLRKAHKRFSSRSLKSSAKHQSSTESLRQDSPQMTPTQREGLPGQAEEEEVIQENGVKLIYEEFHAENGGNHLTSVKPPDGYEEGLRQDVKEAPRKAKGHQRQPSELTSGRKACAGWSTSAIRFAPLNVPLQRRLQTIMVLIHTLSIAGGLALFFFFCTIPMFWPLLLPYLIYVLFSRAPTSGELSHRSEWLRRSKIWSLFASYFPARLHRTEKLEPGRKYVFGYHPHGIISHGAFAAFGTEALGFSQLFPGITNTLLTLDTNFRVPLYRDYALRMGLASVSRESCENILSKGGRNGEGMGRAITIVIGGAKESLNALPHSLRLVLKRRKGFVKLAIRCGADLVPVISFGENDLYDQMELKSHPYIMKGQLLVKKLLGFTVPLFHARGIFNYDVGMMPYRRPINVVVGRAIPIMQSAKPDPAYVDAIHQQYIDELLRIWAEWKDAFAPQRQSELVLVE